MKRKFLIILLTLLSVICCVAMFSACNVENSDGTGDTTNQTQQGGSDNTSDTDNKDDSQEPEKKTYDMSKVIFADKIVVYNGEQQSIFATNLPAGVTVTYDGNGKTNAGNYTVTAHFKGDEVNYNPIADKTAKLTIEKADYDMSSVVFSDLTVIYNEQPQSIFAINLPAGVTVAYDGNGKVDSGVYTVTAHFTGDEVNYNPIPDKTAKLTIEKAEYDMSSVVFSDFTVTYNNQPQSIFATNLPEGVTVTYDGNGKTNAGNYTVTAHFTGDSQNYKDIPDKTANLIINKAEYDMSGVKFENKTVTYNSAAHSIKAEELPNGVTVSYENNGKVNAGTYTVTAHFAGDNQNYKPIPDKEATLTIEKATVTGIVFHGDVVTYDGEEHSLSITGDMPSEITVSYLGNKKINAGTYVVTAQFHTSNNYEPIDDMTATLIIEKAAYDMRQVKFGNVSVPYDGQPHSIIATNLPDGVIATYTGNNQINAGSYPIVAHFEGDKVNHEEIIDMQATLQIEKAVVSGIEFHGDTVTYDGNVHSLAIEGKLPSEVTVSYLGNDKINAGSYLVTAHFETSDNYEPIPEKTATLEIKKARYNMSNVNFGNRSYEYDGETHTIEATDLPQGVAATYEGGERKNAGEYQVTAHFAGDQTNYETIDDKTATLIITKRELTVKFLGEATIKYDGESHKNYLVTVGNLVGQDEVQVSLEYSGNMTDAGVYTLTAKVTNQNYKLTVENTFTVTITRETHHVTFRQDGQRDVVRDVLDLAELPADQIPTPVEEFGYTLAWEQTEFPCVTQDIVVNLQKTLIKYSITYEVGDGTNSQENLSEYSIEDFDFAFKAPTTSREGYQFKSWYLDEEFRTPVTKLSKELFTTYGNLKLYAKWLHGGTPGLRFLPADDGYSYIVVNYTGETQDVVIPEEWDDLPVSAIESYAFFKTAVKNVEIPGSVKKIGDHAFYQCPDLVSVTMLKGVQTVGDYAFAECPNLETVVYASTVTSMGQSALSKCGKLNNLTVPFVESYTKVGGYYYNTTLHNMGVTDQINYLTVLNRVGSEAFQAINDALLNCPYNVIIGSDTEQLETEIRSEFNCKYMVSITICKSVTLISRAFNECNNNMKIYINHDIRTWCEEVSRYTPFPRGASLYIDGKLVEGKLQIPYGVTKIGDYAFSNFDKITEAEIPDSVTSIGSSAFYGCSALTSIEIPDGVASIGVSAFLDCSGLESLTIGSGVTSIGVSAFYGCSGLKAVHITDLAAWCRIDFNDTNPLLYAHHLYLQGAEVKNLTIPSNIKEIKTSAFLGCSRLTSVTILDGVTSIGSSAFADCSGLTSVTIPGSVISIGWSAFRGCNSLQKVVFDDPSNWYYNNQSMQGLSNPVAAAELLRQYSYAWEKRG